VNNYDGEINYLNTKEREAVDDKRIDLYFSALRYHSCVVKGDSSGPLWLAVPGTYLFSFTEKNTLVKILI
jgi:hypothetical protein